jgi:hypothetical protein
MSSLEQRAVYPMRATYAWPVVDATGANVTRLMLVTLQQGDGYSCFIRFSSGGHGTFSGATLGYTSLAAQPVAARLPKPCR